MNELALFAGAGGGILGGKLLGWRTVCAVEWNAYAASVLLARQNDRVLPPFPIWDDVQTFDGNPWRGCVDVVSGGFPCQDISAAGKGAGINGARSGMWGHMARIIGEVRPRFAFVENSPMLTVRGLGRVLGDLAALGYDARWGVLGADDAGAPHQRKRIWIVGRNVADSAMPDDKTCKDSDRRRERPQGQSRGNRSIANVSDTNSDCQYVESINAEMAESSQSMADSSRKRSQSETSFSKLAGDRLNSTSDSCRGIGGKAAAKGWWFSEPNVGRVADGVAAKMDRLKAIGNGQVPSVAALAFQTLSEGL